MSEILTTLLARLDPRWQWRWSIHHDYLFGWPGPDPWGFTTIRQARAGSIRVTPPGRSKRAVAFRRRKDGSYNVDAIVAKADGFVEASA